MATATGQVQNAFKCVGKLKAERLAVHRRPLSPDQFERIISLAVGDRIIGGVILVAICTGLRLGSSPDEILTLVSFKDELHPLTPVSLFLTAVSRDFVVRHSSPDGALRSSFDPLAIADVTHFRDLIADPSS